MKQPSLGDRLDAGLDRFSADPKKWLVGAPTPQPMTPGNHPPTMMRSYPGKYGDAMARFEHDKGPMAYGGYYPISQNYVPGSWGGGAFLIAVLLILLFGLGLLILGYMLIVKPAGTLTVTYQRQSA